MQQRESKQELDELKVELIDRFGLLPEATKNLLQIAEMRLMVKPLKVLKIDAGAQGALLNFHLQQKLILKNSSN